MMQEIFIGKNGDGRNCTIKTYFMHIQLNDNTTLQQIKDVFSDYYPYLRIEFYRKPHKMFETSQEKDLIDSGKI